MPDPCYGLHGNSIRLYSSWQCMVKKTMQLPIRDQNVVHQRHEIMPALLSSTSAGCSGARVTQFGVIEAAMKHVEKVRCLQLRGLRGC